jgi:hypothetical protein
MLFVRFCTASVKGWVGAMRRPDAAARRPYHPRLSHLLGKKSGMILPFLNWAAGWEPGSRSTSSSSTISPAANSRHGRRKRSG